ncbi:MAG: DHHA1 domain-containing protein, partial [Gammaproteobacteria bacterium]
FCGGCHVNRTGDIGLFKIVSESGISAGVRRIEAVTGTGALAFVARGQQTIRQLSELVKASPDELLGKVSQLSAANRALEKEVERLKSKMASTAGSDLASQAEEVNGVRLLVSRVDGFNAKALRDTVDQLKNKLGTAVILLATVADDKVSLVAGVTADMTAKVKAGDLVNEVAGKIGGKGGGRPDMAMAGGNDVAALAGALADARPWIKERL